MIQSNFKIVFSVTVLHTYYENGICNGLQFMADKETRQLMQRFGFKVSYKRNGFDVYVNTKETVPAYLQYLINLPGDLSFAYTITFSDDNFRLFTQLPVDKEGQLTYDTAYNLNTYQDGILTLATDVSEQQGTQVQGNMKIALRDILNYQRNGAAHFRISYAARATQWQYYVINKSRVPLNAPSIGGKMNPGFSAPVPVTIATGQEALLFSSGDNLLPLSEQPKYKFDLVNSRKSTHDDAAKKSVAPKIIFKGLPNPDPGRFGTVSINGKNEVSSPIYLYI